MIVSKHANTYIMLNRVAILFAPPDRSSSLYSVQSTSFANRQPGTLS